MFMLFSILIAPQFVYAFVTDTGVVACTMDAKMCPDGTYVGRTGANCEFVCPAKTDPSQPVVKPTPKPAPTPTPVSSLPLGTTFKKGMSSDTLKDVQTILKSDPAVYSGPVTGYYGAMTEAAVKKIQSKYGIAETGVLDEATQNVLFPSNTKIDVSIISPNGGETWKTGETVNILWKAAFGPISPCIPRPACLDSTPRCMLAEPINGWCANTTSSGNPSSQTASVSASGSSIGVAAPAIMPYFPRASLTLTRDSDPSFVRALGTVNLYETSKSWTVPNGVPEAKDYRVRIAVGGDTPCIYRKETEASAAGKVMSANIAYPCPMMGGTTNTSQSSLYYPNYSTTDSSDNTFAIIGGSTIPDDRITQLKLQLSNVEAAIAKLQEQVRLINEMILKLQTQQ